MSDETHDAPIDAFRARCEARAALVAEGQMERVEAIDGLEHAAASDGLVDEIGQDGVQDILAKAFGMLHHRTNGGKQPKMIRSSAEFVAGFTPPEYVLDGILQRRFIYSITGKTSAGKTAIMLMLAAHVALGRPIGDRAVEQGRVLYLAGENDADVQMRWIAMAQQMDFDIDAIDVSFIAGIFKMSEMMERIRGEIVRLGDVTLILVDTSAAFFEGDNENDNKQLGEHARRLRSLTTMPGGPCVVVACHPPKNAGDDNLQPRGGGSFIAEIDGNLTAKKDDSAIEVHTQGKFRGPDFPPLTFQLRTVTHERLKDRKGRLIPTVIAAHLTERAQEDAVKAAHADEDRLLTLLAKPGNESASQRELATQLGWHMRDGRPYQVRVRRALDALQRAKHVTAARGRYELTKAGEKALKAAVEL
jgi:hypothetical protein